MAIFRYQYRVLTVIKLNLAGTKSTAFIVIPFICPVVATQAVRSKDFKYPEQGREAIRSIVSFNFNRI